jgi:uncharacterized protein YueI
MGWGRMLLLGNVGQQLDIQDTQQYQESLRNCLNTAIGALNKNQSVDEEQGLQIERLQKENIELKLYVTGLVHLLVSKNIIADAEMSHMVSMVDESGQEDHRA